MLDGTKTSIGYRAYMQTDEWKRRSAACIKAAGYRCQVCNSPADLRAHHRTYERVCHELPGDLTALCKRCHEFFHVEVGAVMKVTKVPPATSGTLKRADKRWRKRSAKMNRQEREGNLETAMRILKELDEDEQKVIDTEPT